MRKIYLMFIAFISLAVTSCIENEDKIITNYFTEFDAATYNSNGVGKNYPVVNRVPGYGRQVFTATSIGGLPADPLITRSSGTVRIRVNLVAPHDPAPQTFTYTVVPAETYISGALNADAAVKGTHFNVSGTLTIPENSSYGFIDVQIINPGAALAKDQLIVLELQGNDKYQPNPNDQRIGILINKG